MNNFNLVISGTGTAQIEKSQSKEFLISLTLSLKRKMKVKLKMQMIKMSQQAWKIMQTCIVPLLICLLRENKTPEIC